MKAGIAVVLDDKNIFHKETFATFKSYYLILKQVIESLPCAALIKDDTNQLLLANSDFYRLERETKAALLHDPQDYTYPTSFLQQREGYQIHHIEIAGKLRIFYLYESVLLGWPGNEGLTLTVVNEFEDLHITTNYDSRYELVLEALEDAIFDFNVKENSMYFSDGFYKMLGYQREELPAHKEDFQKLLHLDDRERVITYLTSTDNPKQIYHIEYRIKGKSGDWIWLQTRGRAVDVSASGEILRIVGLHTDITARKLLEKQHELDDIIMKNSVLGMLICRVDGSISNVNEAVCRQLGYTHTEMLNLNIFDLDDKFEQKVIKNKINGLRKNASYTFQSHFKTKTGRELPVEIVINYIGYSDEVSFVIFIQDISLTLKMEVELQESYQKLAEAQRLARLGYWQLDLQSKMMLCSEEASLILDMPFTHTIGFRDLLSRIATEDWRRCYQIFWDSVQQKQRYEDVFRLKVPHGGVKFVRLQARHTYDKNLKPLRSFGIIQDITEKRESKKKIDALIQENALIIKHMQTAIFLVDILPEGQFIYRKINPAYEQTVDMNEDKVVGKSPVEVYGLKEGTRMGKQYQLCIESAKPLRYESTIQTPKGEVYLYNVLVPVEKDGVITQLIGSSLDITSLRKQEAEVRYMSYHDTLTGLYNNAYYDHKLAELNQKENLPMSIIVGDGNGLKIINDVFGHAKGDAYLKLLADILRQSCPSKSTICRTGGDEFIILLPNMDTAEANQVLAEIKLNCLDAYIDKIPVSMALGVATKRHMAEDWQNISKIAENHMYSAKLVEGKKQKSNMIKMLSQILLTKANETEAHSDRLRYLSVQLGERLGLKLERLSKLELLAYFHDIGKVAIVDDILNKPSRLSSEEWDIIKMHSAIGYRIAMTTPELAVIAEEILGHHERWNGSGYPEGKKGMQIPILARIIAVTDAYDAMVSPRVYRAARSKEEALLEIEQHAGSQFDPTVAQAFIKMMQGNT